MTKLMVTSAGKNEIKVTNIRHQPLVTWLYFLNFVTIAIICFLLMKIYKLLKIVYRWLFPFRDLPKCPVILVLSPKNNTIQEIIHQLSQLFDSEVTTYHDVNFNLSETHESPKSHKRSQIIYSQTSIGSQETVSKLKKYVEKTYGFVDILVVSQNEEPKGKNSTEDFLKNLNKQLLTQFWTVMEFLPEMLRRNQGQILSVALERTSLVNTGIMRSIYEELLQCDTKVKLTLIESNAMLDKSYIPSLPSAALASIIVRSMWDSSSVVKVPSLPFYLIMLPVLMLKTLMEQVTRLMNVVFFKMFPQ